MTDTSFEGEEAFDVDAAFEEGLALVEIEDACRTKDSLAYRYLLDVRGQCVRACQRMVFTDPRNYHAIAELQASAKLYFNFADWLKERVQAGQEAANRLADLPDEADITPTFADRDQPQEDDNGSDDD